MSLLSRVKLFANLLLAALLTCGGVSYAAEPASAPTVTLEQLVAAEQAATSSLPAEDPALSTLLTLYGEARSSLASYEEQVKRRQGFEQLRRNGPAESASLIAQVIALREGEEPDPAAEVRELPLGEVEQKIQSGRSELSALKSALSDLRSEVDGFPSRSAAIRERLSALVTLENELDSQLAVVNKAPTPGGEGEARLWSLQAAQASAAAEKAALEAELLVQPTRLELHKAQLDKTRFDADLLEQRLAALEQRAGELRRVEVEDARVEAELEQAGPRGKHELVKALADENAALSATFAERNALIERVRQQDAELGKRAEQLETDLKSIERRLEVLGMTMAIGQILREQAVQLPTRRDGRVAIESVTDDIRDSSSRQIELEDERRQLRDRDAFVASRLEGQPPELVDSLQPDMLPLAGSRRELVKQAIELENLYGRALGDLEFTLRRHLDAVKRYRGFVAERLLWIPSREPFSIFSGDSLVTQVTELVDPHTWREVLAPIPGEFIKQPLILVGIALVLLLIYLTPRMTASLVETGRHVGFVRTDFYASTLHALLLTVLLSLKWPLLMLTGAWLFEMQGDDAGLANALYVALFRMSFYFWVMELQRKLLLPGGLVRRHFRWSEQRSVAVSRCVLRLEQTFLPAGFLMLLCNSLYPRDVGGSLGALAVIALLLSLARFFYRLPPFVQERMESIFSQERSERSTLLGRMTRLFLTWVPILGIVAVISGYSFTALELALLLVRTILLITALLLVHELGLRWLRLTRRKMILKVRQELSKAGGHVGEANPDDEILENDPDLLSDEGTKFINALVIIGGAVGVFVIWSAVLPAFGIFEGVELWHQQGIVDGREAIIPVTLADVFFALFVLLLGWVAMRRIPSLLEIFLRQRVHVSAGSAYAATRVFQYGVTTLLVVYVMGLLGGSWGNIQWAVAALSVGIGFGLQEIVANFISGLIILFEQPIRVGDTVTVGEVSGTVTKIRIRATTIRDWDRRELLVPNKEFVTSRLLNWTLSDAVTRVHLKVGVAYGTDMVEALRVVRLAVEEHPVVLKDPEPIITFDDFGDNSLLITLRFYLDGLDHRLVTTSELRMAINDRFNELGIVVAFPQRDVHLDASEPIPVRMVDGTPARD